MHRILLRRIYIDVPAEANDRTRDFWAIALAAQPHRGEKYPEFHFLEHPAAATAVLVQNIGDTPARFHFDIETDDVAAEVTRLLAAGATEVERHDEWVVLRDPAGLLFCVIPEEGDGFTELSHPVGT